MRAIFILAIVLALSGCEVPSFSSKPETRIVSVPSSKPYRFIKYDTQCSVPVIKRIKLHNETHWKVKQAEAKAAKQ